jgi:hypothetical protein
MRWFRSNMRLGAWCALFALMTQLALSFAHVHLEDFGPRSAAAFSARVVALVPVALPEDEPAVPAIPPSGIAGDFCAICAVMHLADSVLPAASPSVLMPIIRSVKWLEIRTDREHAASPPLIFQARAPPIT